MTFLDYNDVVMANGASPFVSTKPRSSSRECGVTDGIAMASLYNSRCGR